MLKWMGSSVGVVVAVLFAAVLSWGAWQQRELSRFTERARTDALRADSTEAAGDSSRAVVVSGILVAAGDSARLFQRRIVQVQQRSDSLDRALGVERAARYRVKAQVADLTAKARADLEQDTAGVRTAAFSVRQAPYYIDVAVALPPPPGEGQMTARVRVDTAAFEARVGCGPAGAAGVRPATLSLVGPAWVAVRVGLVEQESRVCSPDTKPRPPTPVSLLRRIAGRFAISAGYSAMIGGDGRIAAGPAVQAGWRIWP